MSQVIVKELTVYPVKGCRGTAVEEATLTQRGVVGDRLYTMVENGVPLDQIKAPQLGGLAAACEGDGARLVFSHPDHGSFEHARRDEGARLATKYVLDSFEGIDQGDEVAAWLSGVTGRSVRLITAGEPWEQNLPLDQFSLLHGKLRERFYAVSPVSVSNVASLDDLNGRLKSPVPMNRFRMNVVLEGLEAFQEDTLASLATDSVSLERVTVAERCIIVTTDQETGERRKSDLLQTLNKYRRRPKGERFGSGLVFGAYMAVATEGVLRVGDRMVVG
jgi:uncharacterized protein YcbX